MRTSRLIYTGAPVSGAPHHIVAPMRQDGALAQLVERFAGSEEVRGSTPLGSTNISVFVIHLAFKLS